MEPIYLVALLSFIAGCLGYIIVQFWILPVIRYKRIKRKISKTILDYSEATTSERKDATPGAPFRDIMKSIRQCSVELSEIYNNDLPHWYKMILANRSETPIDASKHLMALGNIRNGNHAEKHLHEIKTDLKIK